MRVPRPGMRVPYGGICVLLPHLFFTYFPYLSSSLHTFSFGNRPVLFLRWYFCGCFPGFDFVSQTDYEEHLRNDSIFSWLYFQHWPQLQPLELWFGIGLGFCLSVLAFASRFFLALMWLWILLYLRNSQLNFKFFGLDIFVWLPAGFLQGKHR